MRRLHPDEGARKPEVRFTPEGAAVDATGIWHEGHASYPGKSVVLPNPFRERVLPASKVAGMGRRMTAEAVVAEPIGEGLNMTCRMEAWPFDGDERRR